MDAPTWSEWVPSRPFSVGLEEEVMLLAPDHDWAMAQRSDDVLPALSPELAEHVSAETHSSVIELATFPHPDIESVAEPAGRLRARLSGARGGLSLQRSGRRSEVLAENRFLASRDGMQARLIDAVNEEQVPALTAVGRLIDATRPSAEVLGCVEALESVAALARETGASRQRQVRDDCGAMASVARYLADDFSAPFGRGTSRADQR